jgi:hypothetical protein
VLGELDTAKIEGIIRLLALRPVSQKTGQPVSERGAKNAIKEFRSFIRWLHKSKSYGWRRPDDYEVVPVKVARTQNDRAKMTSLAVDTFSVDELTTLWRYATPWERPLMTLALNVLVRQTTYQLPYVSAVNSEGRHPAGERGRGR